MNEQDFLKCIREFKKDKPKCKGRTIVRSYKKHILSALDEGYTKKDIFETMRNYELYPFTYATFSKYVSEMLKDEECSTPKKEVGKIGGFNYNPNNIKEKNLI